jgi:hypothetical protein
VIENEKKIFKHNTNIIISVKSYYPPQKKNKTMGLVWGSPKTLEATNSIVCIASAENMNQNAWYYYKIPDTDITGYDQNAYKSRRNTK